MTQVIATDEAARLTHSPELLGDSGPTPERELFTQERLTPAEWMQQWNELAERIGKAWNSDKTATELVSEMRR